jgi:hypothetical protein
MHERSCSRTGDPTPRSAFVVSKHDIDVLIWIGKDSPQAKLSSAHLAISLAVSLTFFAQLLLVQTSGP